MKKSIKIKRITVIALAVLMGVTSILMVCGSLFSKGSDSNFIVPNNPEQGIIYDMPQAMTFSEPTALASDGITLQATLSPSNAYDKTVDWSVAWVDSASSFASGKTVTSYVTVTPTADGANTATVKCLAAFGSQIKITVTSRANSSVTATCTVDYAKRVSDVYMATMITDSDSSDEKFQSSLSSASTYVIGYNASAEMKTLRTSASPLNSTGSITPSYTIVASYEFSPNLITQLQENGLTYATSGEIVTGLPLGSTTDLSGSANTFKHFFADVQASASASSGWVRLTSALEANTDNYDIAIKVTITTEYETAVRYLKVDIDEATMVLPSSITISNGSLVF